MKKIVIVGGGAAGMMAAVQAAKQGAHVTVLEKMNRVGKKILITGKGRCNVTNQADVNTLVKNIPGNGKFLYGAFHRWTSGDTVRFFADLGVPTKVERGNRVFPESDQAADIAGALLRAMHRLSVDVRIDQTVEKICVSGGKVSGVQTKDKEVYEADAVILATGGVSYPGTGSTGDGYAFARALGHRIEQPRPSLVPLETEEPWVKEAQGLSLRNVNVSVFTDGKKTQEAFGEMLFTHFGVSGPVILSLSRQIVKEVQDKHRVELSIDLKPALSDVQLEKRIQRDFEKFSRKQVKNSLHELLPAKLIDIVMDLAYLDPEKPVHQVTKQERIRLAEILRALRLTVTAPRPVSEAIVTAGGVSVKEVEPKTMESKLISGLYFAGEVLDIDGYTGGFNLQVAFSTGYVAGLSAGEA